MSLPDPITYKWRSFEYCNKPFPLYADFYMPDSPTGDVLLILHGGSYMVGDKLEFCRPIVSHFLTAGYIIASMEYRLIPEASLADLTEDIRSMGSWSARLPRMFDPNYDQNKKYKVIVLGSSAGAHLALLTPSLWDRPPTAIISFCALTDLDNVPYLARDRHLTLPSIDATDCDIIRCATNYLEPPLTSFPLTKESQREPRAVMARRMFAGGHVADFLVKGLKQSDGERWDWPENGSATQEEIDAISPLNLAGLITYPPTYIVSAEKDDIFPPSHGSKLYRKLKEKKVHCQHVVVPGVGHAFEHEVEIGSELDRMCLLPAFEFALSI